MTVGQKLHQTLTQLETCKASMESFALDTQDAQAKTEFNQYAQQLESISRGFKQRVNYAEQQEPQYKVKEQAQQKADQEREMKMTQH